MIKKKSVYYNTILKEIEQLKHQLKQKFNIPEIDMKLFTEMDKKSDLQLKELRDKADKRLRELEELMETKYRDEV